MAKVNVEVEPFNVPNFIRPVTKNTADESVAISIKDVDAQCLGELCAEFRREVFEKAGKKDPDLKE